MRCEAIAESLPGVVDGSARLDRAERRHVEQCLRCQAELAQYRKLLRAMNWNASGRIRRSPPSSALAMPTSSPRCARSSSPRSSQ